MLQAVGSFFGRKAPQKGGPLYAEVPLSSIPRLGMNTDRKQTYSKVFRWRLPDGQTAEPSKVEIVGSFTHWQKVPLIRDGVLDAWHATVHHIVGNKTHHYMLLVDGKPVHDKTADGLAIPHGPQEEQYQLMTDKGPRVFMMFGQTK